MIEQNKIYCMDCLTGMKMLSDDSVDLVITSPPYNLGKTVRGQLYDEYKDNLSQDEYYTFIKKVITELIRLTKHYIFFNFQMLSNNKLAYLQLLSNFKHNIKDIIIWHKKQFQPAIQSTCLSSAFEFVVIFAKKELCLSRSFERANFNNRIKGQLNSNVIFGNCAAVKETTSLKTSNKATFPQYFVRWFLKKFGREGDIILDPFMGSGTTAVVCKQFKKSFIGFEISAEYVKIANKRLGLVPNKSILEY